MAEKCDPNAVLDPIILAVIRGAVKEQPTAYDVDKVVKQLEEYGDEMAQFGCDGLLCDMLEVVKGGGIDE